MRKMMAQASCVVYREGTSCAALHFDGGHGSCNRAVWFFDASARHWQGCSSAAVQQCSSAAARLWARAPQLYSLSPIRMTMEISSVNCRCCAELTKILMSCRLTFESAHDKRDIHNPIATHASMVFDITGRAYIFTESQSATPIDSETESLRMDTLVHCTCPLQERHVEIRSIRTIRGSSPISYRCTYPAIL